MRTIALFASFRGNDREGVAFVRARTVCPDCGCGFGLILALVKYCGHQSIYQQQLDAQMTSTAADDWIEGIIAQVGGADPELMLRKPSIEVLESVGRTIEISDGCYELATARRIWNAKINRVMAALRSVDNA